MKKNNLQKGFSGIAAIGIVAAVVVIVIMFGYSVTPKESDTNEAALPAVEKMEQNSTETKDSTATQPSVSGAYQIYDEARLGLADNGKVVLFFNASWCPTCRGADAELKSGKIPDNLIVLSVDYDTNGDLKKKYGVTYQHTFVQVDAKGNMIAKWSGGGLADIISHIK